MSHQLYFIEYIVKNDENKIHIIIRFIMSGDTVNNENINIITINVLKKNDNVLSNITINNSIKIPYSSKLTNNVLDNSNAGILLKDINSIGAGDFYRLNVDSSEYSPTPYLYFNGNILCDSSNLLSELEQILTNYPLETSNIIVKGGYINFFNGGNSNVGPNGVGLRYGSNNTVQFKNEDTDWIDLVDITKHDQFRELIDVDVTTNPLLNNQYITYNATSNLFVNSNLAIINDTNPQLGGDLFTGNHSINYGSANLALNYMTDYLKNPYITLKNNTTLTGYGSYLELANADITGNLEPEINVKSSLPDAGIVINTKGTGNVILNASQGNIYTNSDSIVISGFMQNSIYRTSSIPGGYLPNTTQIMPLTNDTILFNFSNTTATGTYYANITAGIDGQKLNLVYNNKSANAITVLANFSSGGGVMTGTGITDGLKFTVTGQSSSLIYLEDDIQCWQVLNTGCDTL